MSHDKLPWVLRIPPIVPLGVLVLFAVIMHFNDARPVPHWVVAVCIVGWAGIGFASGRFTKSEIDYRAGQAASNLRWMWFVRPTIKTKEDEYAKCLLCDRVGHPGADDFHSDKCPYPLLTRNKDPIHEGWKDGSEKT